MLYFLVCRCALTRQHGPRHSHVSLRLGEESGHHEAVFVILALTSGPTKDAVRFHLTLR